MGFEIEIPLWFILLFIAGAILALIGPGVIAVLLGRWVLGELLPDRPIAYWRASHVVGWTCVVSLAVNAYMLPVIGVMGYLISFAVLAAMFLPRWTEATDRQPLA